MILRRFSSLPVLLLVLVTFVATTATVLFSTPARAAGSTVTIDDAQTSGTNYFDYSPGWIADRGLDTSRWSGGTERYAFGSATVQPTVTLHFTGIQARLYGFTHPGQGIYRLSVDGVDRGTFDGYAPTQTPRQLILDTGVLPSGQHTLELVVTGDKNPASSGTAGQVDFAEVTRDGSENAVAWSAIPQPSSIQLTTGSWTLNASTRLFVVADQRSAVQPTAELLSSELARESGSAPTIAVGARSQVRSGDVLLDLQAASTGAESFTIVVDDVLTITAPAPAGLFYGGQQVVQNLTARGSVPRGTVSSAPAMVERSLHLDIARKHYSKEWIEQQIRNMAYVGLNTLQLHFSENEGFAIQSTTHPEIASPGALSHQDVRDLIDLADQNHVAIVPSFDMPGHMQYILDRFPQFQLHDAAGNAVRGALDISDPAAVQFALGLVDEFTTLFDSSTAWNLGADEIIDFNNISNYPTLQAGAEARFGPGATGHDLITGFVNDMRAVLEAKGKVTRVWNDGMFRSTHIDLDPRVQITWWTNYDPQMARLSTALDAGHSVVNFNDSVFYYVLGENAGYTYPTAERIWSRDWRPGVFTTRPGGPQTLTAPYPPELLGASFAVWSDRPAAQTEEQVAAGVRSPLRAMAERSWNDGSALSVDQFVDLISALSDAPGVSEPLAVPGVVVDADSPAPGTPAPGTPAPGTPGPGSSAPGGSAPGTPGPTASSTSTSPQAGVHGVPSARPGQADSLAWTGLDMPIVTLVATAAGAVLVGGALLLSSRRRRAQQVGSSRD